MSKKSAKLIRILTTAPVFAAILSSLLHFLLEDGFASLGHYLAALGFLTGLPLMAYPVAAIGKRGRDGQRNLAVVFSVIGYVAGFLFALLGGGTATEQVLFGTYLLSGVTIALCSVFHFKASGHTCGCSGPIAMLAAFVSPWFLFGYPLLTPIIWASRKLGRHSGPQLLAGAIIPVVAMLLCRAEFLFH